MNTKIKTAIAVFVLFSAISCTKESMNSQSSLQSSDNSDAVSGLYIGKPYHGGMIFYLDEAKQHGLVAALSDQGTEVSWNNGTNKTTNATGTALGTGLSNTNAIVATQGGTGTYAALLCANYEVGRFKDWYLPSKDELGLLYQQKALFGISEGDYWSSSESSKRAAWEQEYGGGFQFKDSKNFTLHVRAISSF